MEKSIEEKGTVINTNPYSILLRGITEIALTDDKSKRIKLAREALNLIDNLWTRAIKKGEI